MLNIWKSLQNCVLRFVGFDVLPPNIFYGVKLPTTTDAMRQEHLVNWEKRLKNIWDEEPLYFVPISAYKLVDPEDPVKGLEIDSEHLRNGMEHNKSEANGGQVSGPTIGQHLGLQLPKDSMLKPGKVSQLMENGF